MNYEEFAKLVPDMFAPNDPFQKAEPIGRIAQYYWNKYRVAQDVQPARIVELGVRAGYSAWAFVLGCRLHPAHYIGYDAYGLVGEKGMEAEYLANACRLIKPHCASLHIKQCKTAFIGQMPEADLYHIDAGHSTEEVLLDMELVFKTAPGTAVVLLDDVYCKRVYDAVAMWFRTRDLFGLHIQDMRGELLVCPMAAVRNRLMVHLFDWKPITCVDDIPLPLIP